MIIWSKSLAESAARGRIVDELTSTTSIAATLVGMATQEQAHDFPFDAINLWPYLAKNRPIPDDQVFYFASDSSQFFKASAFYRDVMMGTLSKRERASRSFGSTKLSERIFNAVYIKGKDKIVYWSKKDGSARGATYKTLPTDPMTLNRPAEAFMEKPVIDGSFPSTERGRQVFEDFVKYTKTPGSGELMHAAVFQGTDTTQEKRAREYFSQDLIANQIPEEEHE